MTRLLVTSAIVAALVLACVLSGCGGGGDNGIDPPPPVGDTAIVRGTVVQADNPAVPLAGAKVQALGAAATAVSAAQADVLVETTADSRGNFVLRNIPVGAVDILADTDNESSYGAQTIPGLNLAAGDDVRLTITVLPVGIAPPTVITLTPNQATVDPGGKVKFTASVASSSGLLDVTPSYYLMGNVGAVDATGMFTGTRPGDGELLAICGSATASADIEVTQPRDPQVTTFLVAPLTLPASGGKSTITVAANDGDGILQVKAEIYPPGANVISVPIAKVPGTQETYRLEYTFPPNSNVPDPTGHQADEIYAVRVVVTDGSGASTQTGFVDVTVIGIDTPPPPG